MTVLPAGAGIAELAADVRAGRRSAADVVGAHLERLAAANPALNAVVADRADAARSEAEDWTVPSPSDGIRDRWRGSPRHSARSTGRPAR